MKEGEGRWHEIEAILEKTGTMIEVTRDVVEQAARISQYGMQAIDSIIVGSLLSAGCRKVIQQINTLKTTKKGINIINIEKYRFCS